MTNEVTARWIKCHQVLIDNGHIKSSSAFAREIGISRQTLNKITKGLRNVSIDMLTNAVEVFNINPTFLLKGLSPMFVNDNNKRMNVAFLNGNAYAGEDEQFGDLVMSQDVEYFRIPGLVADVDYRCYNVEGDSMQPSFEQGDMIICRKLNHLYVEQLIKDNNVYLIVTQLGDSFVKRVKNKIKNQSSIQLISDNDYYEPKLLSLSQISEIWKVEYKITKKFSSSMVKSLKNQVKVLQKSIDDISKNVNHLIKV